VAPEPTLVVNLSRGNIACDHAVIADKALRRMRGLLGRRELPEGHGILLQPAPSIHTAFMRFPIDVVFIDRNLHVVKVVADMPAWRTASARRARSTLELPAGEAARRGIEVGDQLAVLNAGAQSNGLFTIPPTQVAADAAASAENGASAPPVAGGDDRITHVLLVGSDRRFRSLAALLLTRRGCAVMLSERVGGFIDMAGLAETDVVVLDVGSSLTSAAREAAQIETLDPPVGVVVVGEESEEGLSSMPVLPKWGSFDGLYEAIEHARPVRVGGASNGGS
jgi:uncharacterized membrane protein (UPF0127 family)